MRRVLRRVCGRNGTRHGRGRGARLLRILQTAATMQWHHGLHGAVARRATAAALPCTRTSSLATWLSQFLLHAHLDHFLVVGRRLIAGRLIRCAILVLAVQQLAYGLQMTLQLALMSRTHTHSVEDYHPAGEHAKDAQRADDEYTRRSLQIRILIDLRKVIVGLMRVPASIVMQMRPILLARVGLIAAIAAVIEAVAVQPNGDAVIVAAQKLRADVAIWQGRGLESSKGLALPSTHSGS